MCSKCDGSGKIPFIGKSGKVVPHTFVHCDCHPIYGAHPEPERYRPIRPEDYDFPCSDSFRAFTYQYSGMPDPGSDYPDTRQSHQETYRGTETGKPVVEHIVRHSDLSQQEYRKLREMEGQIKYLQGKVLEMSKQPIHGNKYKDVTV